MVKERQIETTKSVKQNIQQSNLRVLLIDAIPSPPDIATSKNNVCDLQCYHSLHRVLKNKQLINSHDKVHEVIIYVFLNQFKGEE